MEGYEKCTFGHMLNMLIVAGVLSCFISFFVACELSLICSMFFFKTFPEPTKSTKFGCCEFLLDMSGCVLSGFLEMFPGHLLIGFP